MILKDLYIHNYKSFYDTYIEFDKMNILVAPNNAGKSNLIDVLEFINIALEYDIERAIKEKGGFKNILNYNSGEEKIVIEFNLLLKNKINFLNEDIDDYGLYLIKDTTLKCRFSIKERDNYQLSMLLNSNTNEIKKGFWEDAKNYNPENTNLINKITKNTENQKFQFIYSFKTNYKNINSRFFSIEKNIINSKENFLKILYPAFHIKLKDLKSTKPAFIEKSFIKSYYFNPELIKEKSHIEDEEDLKKDSSNLGKNLSFIKDICNLIKTDIFEKISLSLTGIVEEIDSIDVQTVAGQYILIFKEKSGKEININTISDGTINLIATITALNQIDDKSFMLCFEEPERHLHLKAVNYLLNEFRNSDKQILITTHSSEIINHANLNEIIFMYRDSDGYTQTLRADKIKNLKGKLKRLGYKRDLDISSLIDENILGDLEDYQ